MEYEEKVDLLVEYFEESEVEPGERQLGLELEHMVVEEDTLEATSYYESGGIQDLLRSLSEHDWTPVYEDDYVVSLESDRADLTLEPGGQVELSMKPANSLAELEEVYLDFLEEALSPLEGRGKKLLALGYQPESRIEDIALLPKERYEYMYDYFADKGEHAHHMMKGTGAVHVNLDYRDELDYVKKNAVANYLSPLVYAVLDNSPFFEGRTYGDGSLRARIWNSCDPDRCGYPDGVFLGRFGYGDYASYLLEVPVMVYRKDGELVYDEESRVRDVLDSEVTQGELEYILSTVFPDVRTKGYLEVRMGDALPLPYSMGYGAFWKGLLYDEGNLDYLYRECRELNPEEYRKTRREVRRGGVNMEETFSFYRELLEAAESGLAPEEVGYLEPLKQLAEGEVTPKSKTKSRLDRGKAEALSWCDLKNGLER